MHGGKALLLLPHSQYICINVLLKTGKVHSLTAFYKLFLSHINDFDKFLAFFDGFSGCALPLIDTLSFQLMKGVKVV